MQKDVINRERTMKYLLYSPDALTQQNILEILDLYRALGKSWVHQQLEKMKILPFGAHILSDAQCDTEFWTHVHESYKKRNTRICEILESLFEELEASGVNTVCVYENFGAMLRSKACIGCFSSGDVDLTADINDKELIDRVISANGFTCETRRHVVNSRILSSYFNPNELENGLWINVMWQPIARRYVHHNDRISARLHQARKRACNISTYNIRVLNADDLMYLCILHTALGHYYTITPGIRLYVDIDRLARGCEIRWENIAKWSEEDNMGIRVAAVLQICKDLLGTPIQDDTILTNSHNKYFVKLMEYLYNESTGQYCQRASRLERMYIDLVSDGKHPLKALVDRVVSIRHMEG